MICQHTMIEKSQKQQTSHPPISSKTFGTHKPVIFRISAVERILKCSQTFARGFPTHLSSAKKAKPAAKKSKETKARRKAFERTQSPRQRNPKKRKPAAKHSQKHRVGGKEIQRNESPPQSIRKNAESAATIFDSTFERMAGFSKCHWIWWIRLGSGRSHILSSVIQAVGVTFGTSAMAGSVGGVSAQAIPVKAQRHKGRAGKNTTRRWSK